MIEKITDQNLERYDSRLKEWCDRKFFEKGNYGKYQTTEEAGIVAFYPAPNTPLEGKVKFSFTETMPASGDKGPENPSTITGVTKIDVLRTAISLIPKTFSPSYYNLNSELTFVVNQDGSVTINGDTATNNAYIYLWGNPNDKSQKIVDFLIPKNTGISFLYEHISGTVSVIDESNPPTESNPVSMQILVGDGDDLSANRISKNNPDVVSTRQYESLKYFKIRIASWKGYRFSNYTVKPYMWFSDTSIDTDKENVNEKFTINLGDTYYGGSLDVATGVMTVTWVGHVFDGTENFDNPQTLNYVYRFTTSSPVFPSGSVISIDIDHEQLSTHFIANGFNSENSQPHFYISSSTGNVVIFSTETSSTNLKTWLASQYSAGTPLVMVAKYVVPPTVQLSPVQILSLTQADKYTPRLNTVYTDADSVQISYLKSPIRDEYEKTQAILSLGGNS